ncbi:MAG: hypothetical protein P4L74_07400 [Candidatus Doudnabacteria bacterium]|nr:hypothetical protein [Candidatus Doudnabacteria bacterium]
MNQKHPKIKKGLDIGEPKIGRLVLAVPKPKSKAKKFVAMEDIRASFLNSDRDKKKIVKITGVIPSAAGESLIPKKLSSVAKTPELIPEIDTVKPETKPLVTTQPFISSLIIRQKSRIKLLPKTFTAFKLAALTVLCLIVSIPAMSAFEAHVVNVTAQLKEITPPTLTPPGSSVAWDDHNGGTNLSGNINVVMSDGYIDASDIYYTFGTGTIDPGTVPNPVCGQTGPNGGGGDKTLPQQLSINADTVIKAIACDGITGTAHSSYVNTKIYSFGQPVQNLVINEFLPNPTGTAAGNQGVSGGHNTGNGGEWVELYNNGTSTIDTDGFVLYDDFVPTTTPASQTWTTNSDFNSVPPPIEGSTTVSGGSVLLTAGSLSGTFEKVFDIGTNKKASWGNVTMANTITDPAALVCLSAATSDDGVNFTPYVSLGLNSCATASSTSISLSLASLPQSRFIKWQAAFSRNDATKALSLNSLSINYSFVDYNTYHELVITTDNTNNTLAPGTTIMDPGDFLVVYRDGNPNFDLDSQVNAASLYDGHLYLGAGLIDSHAYDLGGSVPVGNSIARIPNGSSNWVDPCPTPGAPNTADCLIPANVSTTTPDSLADATSTPDSTSTIISDTGATSTPDTATSTDISAGGSSVTATSTDATSTPEADGASDTTISTSTDASAQIPPPDNSTTTTVSTTSPDLSTITTPTPTPGTTVPGNNIDQAPADNSSGVSTPPVSPPPVSPPPSSDQSAPANPPVDNSDSSKQPDAITPPQQNQQPAVTPAPTSSGGDGSPPPPPPADPTPATADSSSGS